MAPVIDPEALGAAGYTLQGLRTIPTAITTGAGDRTNGLMTLSGGPASIVPEGPRALVGISKYNFSHDLIHDSERFALHVLSAEPTQLAASLDIIRVLGARSGRDGDKLAGLATRPGRIGVPVLLDALSYVEVVVTGSYDNDENCYFFGDVVAAERLRKGPRLTVGEAWPLLGDDWIAEYERGHEPQVEHSRRLRGL
jgi:flavin reductase (DIM6/NTAB) family NADH-FMN oxidoreductase RutF